MTWTCTKACKDPDAWRCVPRIEGQPATNICKCDCHRQQGRFKEPFKSPVKPKFVVPNRG